MDLALSIVIPVYNEAINIDPLINRIAVALQDLPVLHEVIVVDDGSHDATVAKLLALKQKFSWLKVIELRRNYGQHAATYAGFDIAEGRIVVTLDGDLQNDPADIPKLLNKMSEGFDVVCGWRTTRKDPFFSRKLPSLIVNKIIRNDAPTPIHDYGCFLRAYTQSAAKELSYYATSRGWFPILFSKLGFRVAEVPVTHHERPGGEQSKHNVFTRLDQFMSVFMGATTRPFQFVEIIGVIAITTGGLGAVVGLVTRLAGRTDSAVWWVVSGGIALGLWGFSLLVLGMVGEYLVRMNYEIGRKPKYLVRHIHS